MRARIGQRKNERIDEAIRNTGTSAIYHEMIEIVSIH